MLAFDSKSRGIGSPHRVLRPLENGALIQSHESFSRHERMPHVKKAGATEGFVDVGSPVSSVHALPDGFVQGWLAIVAILALLTALPNPLTAAQPAILWDGSQADFFSDTDGPFTLGFQFRAETDLTVTALGAFDYLGDGLVTSHAVGIWTLAGGSPIATVTVPAGSVGSLVGQFRYMDVAGITLSANTEYIIGASDFYGTVNDIYAGSVPKLAFSTSAAVTFLGYRGAGEEAGLVFPTYHIEPLSPTTFGANFQSMTVPEPSPWALLGAGLVLFASARRIASARKHAICLAIMNGCASSAT